MSAPAIGPNSINIEIGTIGQPNYTFPKETLPYVIGTVALAIFAAFIFISPIPSFKKILLTIGLLGGCLAASAKAYMIYKENLGKAEYEFAMRIKSSHPTESEKWLKKAAIERCYNAARLELAETTSDADLKSLLVKLLNLRGNFHKLSFADKGRVTKLWNNQSQ